MTRPPGIHPDVPEAEYHSAPGLSYSGAKLLLPPSCPAKYREAMDNPPAPKREYDFGHLAHKLLLGVGGDMVVLDPAVHGLKKDGTVADSPRATAGWKAAEAEARERGATPVHIDEMHTAEAMVAAIRNDAHAGPLFAHGAAEQSVYTTDPATGIALRARFDWVTTTVIDGRKRVVVVDYKTADSAEPNRAERIAHRFAYYMQAAHYTDMARAVGLDDQPEFRMVIQEKKPPYVVQVCRFDDFAIREGRRAFREAIDLYIRCRDTNTWPYYVDGEVLLSLPAYALDDEMDVA